MITTDDEYEFPIFEDTDMEDLNLYSSELAAALKVIMDSGIFDGKSAYQIWLDLGNQGTEQDFIDSLEGPTGPAGTTDFNNLTNKPTKLSDFTNDSGFIDNTVNNLTNYYTKSDTYTKTEVNGLIAQIPRI